MKTRELIAATAAGLSLLLLGACSGDPEESDTKTPTSADGSDDGSDPTVDFGESYTWDNGLMVTVSDPIEFRPDSTTGGGDGKGPFVRFTITVLNESGAEYVEFSEKITVHSGNAEAERIFDSGSGLNQSPEDAVPDGANSSYDIGFAVADPKDLDLEFQPGDLALDPVHFTD